MKNFNKTLESLIQQGASFDVSNSLVEHKSRAGEYEIVSYNPPRGRESDFVAFCKEFEAQYNEASQQAAKEAIEAEIAAEVEAERKREENRIAAEVEAEKQRKEAENALKEQHEAELEAERAKIAEYDAAKASKKNKATKSVMWFSLFLLLLTSIVTFAMNNHNLGVLYGEIINKWYLGIFAVILALIPFIFAWLKDSTKVEQSTWILPVDFTITVVLFFFCSPNSPLVEGWQGLKENLHYVLMIFSLLGVGFYAYQVYMIYNKLLAIIADEKYEEFFNKLFE